jgi:hypothetical protein
MSAQLPTHRTEPIMTVAGRIACWLSSGSLLVAAVAWASIHAPPRVKVLGLFAVVTGGLAGWLLGRLAWGLGVRTRRVIVPLAFVMTAAGQVGVGLGAHRIWADGIRQQYQADPSGLLTGQIAAPESISADPDQQAQYEQILADYFEQHREERADTLARITRFGAYLQYRVSVLPDWFHAWAGVFWGLEIVLAGVAGAWVAGETVREGGFVAEDNK